jgi:hypothetical protein
LIASNIFVTKLLNNLITMKTRPIRRGRAISISRPLPRRCATQPSG